MRCAILTRVSTEEQTRPDYNSLQTQEEICRAYVDVQRENGWTVTRVYHDPGFSGKDLKRPGIQSLMADVASGLIDVVLAYKLDRVSRSLQDFYKFWSVLQANGVSFVSATQAFDTTTPAGVLMLNVLLSFGQYERELTVERTATKMRARAEKGLWNGGFVPLGYAYDKATQLLSPIHWSRGSSVMPTTPSSRAALSMPQPSSSTHWDTEQRSIPSSDVTAARQARAATRSAYNRWRR